MKKYNIKTTGYFFSILSNYTTYIDSCIFLDERTAKTWKNILVRRLALAGKKFIVIHSVLLELNKKALSDDVELAGRAKRALADIQRLQEQGLCEIEADAQRGFADAGFLELFARKRFHENLLLVTRDQKLARDILKQNNFSSARSYREILVWRMGNDGLLDSRYNWFSPTPHLPKPSAEPSESITCVDCNKSFELTGPEKKFYLKKGLCVPKRCPECRECRQREKIASDSDSTSNNLKRIFENTKTVSPSRNISYSSGSSLSSFWGSSVGQIFGSLLL